MKKILFPLLLILIGLVACKKDKTICFQSDITLTYDTYSQYDSSYTTKTCQTEEQWENLTFENYYNPITGELETPNEVGTRTSYYYRSDRMDWVTKKTVTYSVAK